MIFSGKLWTWSNALSMLRVVLLIPIVPLLLNPTPVNNAWAAAIALIAGFTDLFDGMLARALNQVTELGKIIDPVADKLCVAVVATILTVQGRLPLWFIAFVLIRDTAIFIGGIHVKRTRGVILMSNVPGKWAVAFISFLILFTILQAPPLMLTSLLVISTTMLAISSYQYLMRFLAVLKEPGISSL